jgi:hypothetical protein
MSNVSYTVDLTPLAYTGRVVASQTNGGITQMATVSQVLAGTRADRAISPLTLAQAGFFPFPTVEGTVTTVGATTATVITFDLGSVASVYSLDVFVEGFDSGTPAGVAYALTGGIRTTGSAGTIISTPMIDSFEESALTGASFALAISGNNLLLQVTGVAAKTIAWKARLSYVNG